MNSTKKISKRGGKKSFPSGISQSQSPQQGSHQKTPDGKKTNRYHLDICKQCGETNGVDLVECECCEEWLCFDCSELTTEEFNILAKQNSNMHWYCKTCTEPAVSAVKSLQFIQSLAEELKEDVNKRIEMINADLQAFVKEQAKKNTEFEMTTKTQTAGKQTNVEMKTFMKKQEKMNHEVQQKLQDQSNNAAKVSVKELHEREVRKSNIVLFNIPESTSEDTDIRKEEDLRHVTELCKILNVENNFGKLIRLGKKTEKDRPLKIVASDSSTANDLLRAAKNLANVDESSIYKKVGINRDLTFLEREERRALVREKIKKMKEAVEKGQEAKWIIRNGALINLAKKVQNQEPGKVQSQNSK